MYTFKCVHTGTEVKFASEYDANLMRKHPEYTEVLPSESKAAETTKKTLSLPKQAG